MPLSPYVDPSVAQRPKTQGRLGAFKRSDCCKHCGQRLPDNIRFEVRLSPIKLRIFDAIHRQPGITQRQIHEIVYPGKSSYYKNIISTHVAQINDLYAHTDIHIVGVQYSGFRLVGVSDGR